MDNLLFLFISEGDWSNSFGMIGQFFYILLLLFAVSALAYFVTKKIASLKFASQSKKFIKVIESHALSSQCSIQLVKTGSKYILLGISKEKITFLAETTAEDIIENQSFENLYIKKTIKNFFLPTKEKENLECEEKAIGQ